MQQTRSLLIRIFFVNHKARHYFHVFRILSQFLLCLPFFSGLGLLTRSHSETMNHTDMWHVSMDSKSARRKHNARAKEKQTCIHPSNGIRNHNPNIPVDEKILCLSLHGHCNPPKFISLFIIGTTN
jgi:hypothetical protein